MTGKIVLGFILLLTCLTSVMASPNIQLNGCWSSRDAVLTENSGSSFACKSGVYLHFEQTQTSFKLIVLSFDCNQNVPLFGDGGPYSIQGTILRDSLNIVGSITEKSLTLNLMDPQLGTSFVETVTVANDNQQLTFTEQLVDNGKLLRTLKGSLRPVACLE